MHRCFLYALVCLLAKASGDWCDDADHSLDSLNDRLKQKQEELRLGGLASSTGTASRHSLLNSCCLQLLAVT